MGFRVAETPPGPRPVAVGFSGLPLSAGAALCSPSRPPPAPGGPLSPALCLPLQWLRLPLRPRTLRPRPQCHRGARVSRPGPRLPVSPGQTAPVLSAGGSTGRGAWRGEGPWPPPCGPGGTGLALCVRVAVADSSRGNKTDGSRWRGRLWPLFTPLRVSVTRVSAETGAPLTLRRGPVPAGGGEGARASSWWCPEGSRPPAHPQPPRPLP